MPSTEANSFFLKEIGTWAQLIEDGQDRETVKRANADILTVNMDWLDAAAVIDNYQGA